MKMETVDMQEQYTSSITNLFESSLEEVRNYTAHHISNWKNYLSKECLIPLLDEQVPKNRDSNLLRIQSKELRIGIEEIVRQMYPNNHVKCSGYFYYPPTGYMGWHTNHDNPSTRLYITYSSEDNKSFFRYYEDGGIVTDYDKKGITVRKFECPGTKPYLWHCVGSECDRISIGFTLKHLIKISPQTRYAVIKNEQVVNVIEWNGDTSVWKPPSDTIAVFAGADGIDIGTKYINGNFIIPSVS